MNQTRRVREWPVLLAALLLLVTTAACSGAGEHTVADESQAGESRAKTESQAEEEAREEDISPTQLIFEDPPQYARHVTESGEVVYQLGEEDKQLAKIVLSGDNEDHAIVAAIRQSLQEQEYHLVEDALGDTLARGRIDRTVVAGYAALRLEGKPVPQNNHAVEGGKAFVVLVPVEEQMVVVEGYCAADYEEDFRGEFARFLEKTTAAPLITALEESMGAQPGELL